METTRTLVVVGGGVAGLAGARWAVLEGARRGLALRVVLLEAAPRLGGKVWSERAHDDGALLEWGPDALVASRVRGRDLLEELGLLGQAVAPATGRAYLLLGGRLRPLPGGTVMGIPRGGAALRAAARAGILSPWGAVRAAAEPLAPRLTSRRTGLDRIVRRRFGPQVADRLVDPLVAAVFGVSAAEVGLEAALPGARTSRSLMLAARRRPTVSFLGLRDGMGTLVGRLREDLSGAEVRTGVSVRSIAARGRGFEVRTSAGLVDADAVLVAVPAPAAVALLREVVAAGISPIAYASSAVAHLRYPPGALRRPPDAAGYLVPAAERGAVAACSWVSTKWSHLAGHGPHLRAVAIEPAARISDDEELLERITEEVGRVMGATARPRDARLHRWRHALPVYTEWHDHSVRRIRDALPSRVEVAGASYDGIGIPDCVRSGEDAATRLVAGMGTGAVPECG